MPRQNKKTRIKGLPPKLQLDRRDNTTGSLPTKTRISSDNRTGQYNVSWNDNNTIVFGNVGDIRDSIINYYRFNSGSTSNEVMPNSIVDGTASFVIRPTFTNTASFLPTDLSVNFTFQMHETGSNAGFRTTSLDLPWDGSDYDPNLSSINYNRDDYSFAVGPLNIFNPGKITAVSGTAENPFSVSFWIRNSSAYVPGVILSVAKTNASWSNETGNKVSTDATFIIENSTYDVIATIVDTDGNGVRLDIKDALPDDDTFRHVVFTYDGSTTSDGMNFYLNSELPIASSRRTPINEQGTLSSYSGMQTSYTEDVVSIGSLGKRLPTIFGGDIDELIFFNRVLSQGEIVDLYLSRVSIHTPSKLNRFSNGTYLGSGLRTNSPYWYNGVVDDLTSDFSTSLYQPGSVRKGVGDQLAHFTPGQSLEPFRDSGNPAVDGKSTNDSFYSVGSKVEDAGQGFAQPLWSKTKIEIDLSVNGASSFSTFISRSGTEGFLSGSNYPMAYYNFASKTWEGIGVGRPWRAGGTASTKEFAMQGFTAGLVNLPGFGLTFPGYDNLVSLFFEFHAGAGRITDKFGFPFAPRYHATSSQLYQMSNVISEPFLVEKIVYEFSGALHFDPEIQNGKSDFTDDFILTASFAPAAISNFFILNQRRPYNLQYTNREYVFDSFDEPGNFTHTIPTSSLLASGSTRIQVDTIRDVISYGALTSFASNVLTTEVTRSSDVVFVGSPDMTRIPKTLLTRDLNIETGLPLSNSLSALDWSGNFKFEVPAKSPNSANVSFMIDLEDFDNNFIKNAAGGRNNLGITRPSGRDLRSPISAIQTTTPTTIFYTNFVLAENGFDNPNPYLLLPTDQLIVGWQQPIIMRANDWSDLTTGTGSLGGPTAGTGILSTMTMTGPAKIILYGSQVRSGEEFHDTLNQLLTTNAAHEVIE